MASKPRCLIGRSALICYETMRRSLVLLQPAHWHPFVARFAPAATSARSHNGAFKPCHFGPLSCPGYTVPLAWDAAADNSMYLRYVLHVFTDEEERLEWWAALLKHY